MPVKLKALGYTLQPGERFTDDVDLPEHADVDDSEEEDSSKPIEINKEKEILDKLAEIEPKLDGKPLPWIETLNITGSQPCFKDLNRNETLKIEEHFKELASTCVKEGLMKLSKLGVAFNRPSDFYADMVKTDFQMDRVMKKLANRTKAIQERKKTQKVKVKKGFDKQVKQQQRKNKFIKEVDTIRKSRSGDKPIEKQINSLMEKHAKEEVKSRKAPVTTKKARTSSRSNKKPSGKPQNVSKKGNKKPKGKNNIRAKGTKRTRK